MPDKEDLKQKDVDDDLQILDHTEKFVETALYETVHQEA